MAGGLVDRDRSSPLRVRAHDLVELVTARLRDPLGGDGDAGVGEEDVQPAVLLQRLVDDPLDVLLFPGVHLARVDLHGRVERGQLALVRLQVRGGVVADEDGFGAVTGELVDRGAPDAGGGVGARDDDDFVLDAAGDAEVLGAFRAVESESSRRGSDGMIDVRDDDDIRASRVACYGGNLGDILKHPRVLSRFGQLLAESLYSCLGRGRHDGCSSEKAERMQLRRISPV